MLAVIAGAVAKLIVPADQFTAAPFVIVTMFKLSVPPATLSRAFVRRFVVPFRFIVAPVAMLSVADVAEARADEPPMFAIPAVVKDARLPLSETVPVLPSFSPTSRPKALTV